MKTISFQTRGTCAKLINITLTDEGLVEDVEFVGGCNGNTKGISSLVRGMKAEDVIKKVEGITCGMKQTSCPDQLAQALRQMV
ncbi:MAG: TIGR03905 family TSCPD domain-containing protein [Bacteroidales bacterium]|nr:TIGR03905 family TSCPD domain-containing protein [Bacteroidales bacterium]MCM1147798.1 TIGR03905 family TSCPD domain-containing protein [Bacteroidales bacterium]MCM1206446.1 TIGR03905 family TSCPD domain-containing protein [Bacillota bacterium]MCM1510331.1 TIGR03905 family TSCPD domain-containing protein [Clostridium sp.]